MSMKMNRKPDTEKWENRELGASAEHAIPSSPETNKAVDDALGLQLISIRLQAELIEELKALAKEEGLGYQPLIRSVLTKYVSEKRSTRSRSAAAR